MARTGAVSLASCACVVTICGCAPLGYYTFRAGHGSFEQAPASIADPGNVTVLEISCDYFDLFSAGVALPNNGDAIGLYTVGLNWGALLETGGYHPERQWLVASTYVGHWDWAVPPNRDGLITGIRLGVRSRHHVKDGKYLALEASYDWKWLKDVSGDEDARLDTLSLGIALLNWW